MILLIVLIVLVSCWILLSIIFNSMVLYETYKLKEKPTKFLYEDGNHYWFTIDNSSGRNKISVYGKNPLSLRWNLLLRGDSCRIDYKFLLDNHYDEKTIEEPIKEILKKHISLKVGSLKNFKGYVGDIPKSMLRDSKLKDLGI